MGPSPRAYGAAIPDPRIERTKRHPVLDSRTIAIGAGLCGADAWVDVEVFGQATLPWLRTLLAPPQGIPSHDTFGRVCAARVCAALDPQLTRSSSSSASWAGGARW